MRLHHVSTPDHPSNQHRQRQRLRIYAVQLPELRTQGEWRSCGLVCGRHIAYTAVMIKHIVFWNLKDEALGCSREENREKLKTMLKALPGAIPQIRDFEVGLNFNPAETAYEVALNSSFASREDLAVYQAHPAHQEVVEFVKAIVSDRAVVDYEV